MRYSTWEVADAPSVPNFVKALRPACRCPLVSATSLLEVLEVLDAVRAQQDVLTDYYGALHDYWIAVFGLHAARGESRPN